MSRTELPSALRLRLLGAPQIQLDGRSITKLSVKAQALLYYLALTQETHLRTTLATLLWDEIPEKNAFANLRKVIQQFRALLPDHIKITRQAIGIDEDAEVWVDVNHFEALIAELGTSQAASASPSISTSAPSQMIDSRLTEAESLYQGDFLAGFFVRNAPNFEAWQLTQQARLREMVLDIMMMLSQQMVRRNNLGEAINAIQRMLDLEPWRESAHRHLMELLVRNGRRHAAMIQYEVCRQALADELGVQPSEETIQLYQQIRDGVYPGIDSTERIISDGNQGGTTEQSHAPSTPHPSLRAAVEQIVPSTQLFGVDAAQDELLAVLQRSDRPWLVSIDGIGGIGKTSLAQLVVNQIAKAEDFPRIAWVSAKQEEFRAVLGIQKVDQAALSSDQLVDELLEQLTEHGLASTPREKALQLASLLKEQPTLVVIDNLETVADYEALVPTLQDLANPSKFLITSRHALSGYGDVFRLTLGELSQEKAIELLRHEATMRGIRGLSNANDETWAQFATQITDVVGGHPLALNLVLGQLSFLPLENVLKTLKQATSQHVDEFYTYIYWQAWQGLDAPARQLFLAMPMLFNATYDRLGHVSKLGDVDLQPALSKLIAFSLVQVAGDLLEPRYRLHRLTETFLLNEVIKWNKE